MNNPFFAESACDFPTQPVHVCLLRHLQQLARQWYCRDNEAVNPFFDGMDFQAVRLTLLCLEGKDEPKRSLAPSDPGELARLKAEGTQIMRRLWKRLRRFALSRSYTARKRACLPLDSLEGDGLIPCVELYHGTEAEGLLGLPAAPTMQALTDLIRANLGSNSRADEEGRVILLALEFLWGNGSSSVSQQKLYDAVRQMGYALPKFETMKKWLARKKARLRPYVQTLLTDILGGLPADHNRRARPSSEGLVDVWPVPDTGKRAVNDFAAGIRKSWAQQAAPLRKCGDLFPYRP